MLVEFDFHVLQLRYVKAAMTSIPTYKPGLIAGTNYNFKVTGRNSLGQGPESAVASKVAT